MPTRPIISKTARKAIESSVNLLFERIKARLLGPDPNKSLNAPGKKLVFSFTPENTLLGLFAAGSKEEGVKNPDFELLSGLMKITESYLDAVKERAKAQVIQNIQSFLHDVSSKNDKVNVKDVLKEQLTDIWGKVHSDVKRIVETETTIVRNMGIDDGIRRISSLLGESDPVVFFLVVRDGNACTECTDLHLMPDKTTPRAWKRSEVGSGYHKKGDLTPKIGGLHPHCRCLLSVLQPGFGFDSSGKVIWKGKSWNEYREQRG